MTIRGRGPLLAPAFAVAFFLAIAFSPPAPAQDALSLLHKMQAALGGADKIAAIRDYQEQVRADIFDPNGKQLGVVVKRTRWVQSSYLRLDQIGPFDTYALYFDGASGWEILPDKSVKNLAGGELKFARNYLWGFDLNIWLADRDAHYRITSPEPNVVRISSATDPTEFDDILLDRATSLPLKQLSQSLADPAHPVTSEMRFEKWETVGGVKFPSQRANFHDGARMAALTTEFLELNTNIKISDLAAKPANLKPVLIAH
jgi:hypothetical protein